MADENKEELIDLLFESMKKLYMPALKELIRLLKSESDFNSLTKDQITQTVWEYQPLTVNNTTYFDKPFTTGKEPAIILLIAQEIGREFVLEELEKVLMSL